MEICINMKGNNQYNSLICTCSRSSSYLALCKNKGGKKMIRIFIRKMLNGSVINFIYVYTFSLILWRSASPGTLVTHNVMEKQNKKQTASPFCAAVDHFREAAEQKETAERLWVALKVLSWAEPVLILARLSVCTWSEIITWNVKQTQSCDRITAAHVLGGKQPAARCISCNHERRKLNHRRVGASQKELYSKRDETLDSQRFY